MSVAAGRVRSVQVGAVARLGDAKGTRSAFIKHAVSAPVQAAALGLDGDEQADHSVHGGPDKAVYVYPHEHYASWATAFPQHAPKLRPGIFGENLTVEGYREDEVAIGDRFRAGGAVLEVSEPRQPCFKFAHVFADNTLGRFMIRTGMTGWYVRVLEPGPVGPDDGLALLARPHPRWTVRRLTVLLGGQPIDPDVARELAGLPALSGFLRASLRKRLQRAAS